MARRGHRRPRVRKRDRTEKGQRSGGYVVAAARSVADGKAHHPGGRTRVRRVHQGHDGGTMRGLDAKSVAGLGCVCHGRPEGTKVSDGIILVSIMTLDKYIKCVIHVVHLKSGLSILGSSNGI